MMATESKTRKSISRGGVKPRADAVVVTRFGEAEVETVIEHARKVVDRGSTQGSADSGLAVGLGAAEATFRGERVMAGVRSTYFDHPTVSLQNIPIGRHTIPVEVVSVTLARDNMADLLHGADSGRAFLIRNTRSANGEARLLIDPDDLALYVDSWRNDRKGTFGEFARSMPFAGQGASDLTADAPCDEAASLDFDGQ